ncbi:hypothetical protein FZD47_02390 [Bacillus infantis]|uniref:Uncharacterized protein n=1 Tax=Bacillus infantis TaxID=324767 RepID=A0A5D4SSK0_9BACI|nr:hypothetical protein [Bacillus infantis]TYS66355.1 hypothetical protein FZD47_02390 [Bacillus infantis]
MDIEELKGSDNITILKDQAIETFRDFSITSNKLTNLLAESASQKKENFFKEFEYFFLENGFALEKLTKKSWVARYRDVEVFLNDNTPSNNEPEAYLQLEIPSKKVYSNIEITVKSDVSERIYWKHNIENHGQILNKANFSKEINKISNSEELEGLIKKIIENDSWYKNTIKNYADITFVYKEYNGFEEFNSFEEYFKYLKPNA